MNYKTKLLYELCCDCKETFNLACYLCYEQSVEELKEVEMDYVLGLWNKRKVLNGLSIWLDSQTATRFSLRSSAHSSRCLQIKPGGMEDNKKEHVLCLVKKWMCEYLTERHYVIEEHNKRVVIY